jgi:hypothetical protein
MNNAMETAKCKNPFADIVKQNKKTILTSRNDNTPLQDESFVPFKARSMPKFSTLHDKINNKENSKNSSTVDRILDVNNKRGFKNPSRLEQVKEIKSSGPFSFY